MYEICDDSGGKVGLLRLFLALCVIAGHTKSDVFGSISWIWSTMAVFVFFVISGFYMALVMDTKYRSVGIGDFYLSRAARIYPTYWLAAIFSVASLLFMHGTGFFGQLSELALWQKIYLAFTNIFVFGQDATHLFCMRVENGGCLPNNQYLLNAPGWSISAELMFYLICPLLVRSLAGSSLMIFFGLVYALIVSKIDISTFQLIFDNPGMPLASLTYYFFPASFAFFGAGACAYYAVYKVSRGEVKVNAVNYIVAVLILIAADKVFTPILSWWWVALMAMMAPSVFLATKDLKYDRLIGELSYPVYMFHYPIMKVFEFYKFQDSWIGLGNITAIVSIVIGVVVYVAIDKPIDKWRHSKFSTAKINHTYRDANLVGSR
jgi:peptidoglycan/LPS O-acetylase OafA/YrhL